jgi:hypothetical protein
MTSQIQQQQEDKERIKRSVSLKERIKIVFSLLILKAA